LHQYWTDLPGLGQALEQPEPVFKLEQFDSERYKLCVGAQVANRRLQVHGLEYRELHQEGAHGPLEIS
jgi:hypothetical protein